MYTDYGDEETWLLHRTAGFGIGASATPAILGKSPYRGPWAVWCAHKAPHLTKPVGAFVRDGNDLEPAVVRMFARREGLTLHHHEFGVYQHPRIEWLRFSPDATLGESLETPRHHFEIKCVMSPEVASHLPPSGDMPLDRFTVPHWAYQGLHQLAVCPSLRGVTIVALLPWFEIRTYRIDRTPETRKAIGIIATRIRDWRERYLVGDEMPEADDSVHCSMYMDWSNPAPKDWSKNAKKRPQRTATEAEARWAYQYSVERQEEKRAKSQASKARNMLLETIGDAYRLELPCGGSVKVSSHSSRRVTVEDKRRDNIEQPNQGKS